MYNQSNKLFSCREAIFLSYLAGIMDGEGTIRIGSSQAALKNPNWNKKYYAAISLGMTNRVVIEMFVKKFGSKIREERVTNRKLMYRWGTSGNTTVPVILRQLLPYLVVKKEQAKLVIEYCSKIKTTGFRRNKKLPIKQLLWREKFFNKVKKLNAVGPVANQ